MVDQYIFSGSLPENASTYVTREADAQLYEGLKAGKFCYVLNSRQSGKSSLRVRTMQRLRESGVQCAAVDLSAGGIQNVPPEQWYADLIDTLIDSFGLDIDFGDWWEVNQLNTLVTRFRKFLEEVLLVEVQENIVIFIDEIDSVLSLNFPTDDFFALIRACYNKRVDNSEYNRLTFCLLGVAAPSNLIEDKQRTPFNIGKAISLKGFQLHEAEPLENGLQEKFNNLQAIMQEILQWTGGQPFLTQKLCQFMVEESEQPNPRSVEQVVSLRIIENWESQDEPEHLRTIQARILRDEQRAGYLLELYQQVRLSEESQVIADETLEQSELQLSGLVVKQQGKLRIYNQIYREVFNSNWIENQLNNLRPYSENFRFWFASGGTDESRLLRGKALQEAEEWAKDKNLSYQDKQYLAASKEKEIQEKIVAKEQEAALERERQDREAAEARNSLLDKANKKAKIQIRNGTIVLIITSSLTLFLGLLAFNLQKQADDLQKQIAKSQKLLQTARELANFNSSKFKKEDERIESSLKEDSSIKVSDYDLQVALMNLALAVIYQEKAKDIVKSEAYLEKVYNYLKNENTLATKEKKQIFILYLISKGRLFNEKKDKSMQLSSYTEAYNFIQQHKKEIFNEILNLDILLKSSIEILYKELIWLTEEITDVSLKTKVEVSLKEYYYTEIENQLKNANIANSDELTRNFILYLAGLEEDKLDEASINKLQSSCLTLKKIDNLWNNYTQNSYSFSVQKKWYKFSEPKNFSSKITTKKIRQAKVSIIQKWDIISVFIPPVIAKTQPYYPSLGFKYPKILSICPFEIDLAEDGVVFDPPTNIRIRPDISAEKKCSIESQEIIRVYQNFKDAWYYTDACNGGWINKTQVRLKRNQQ
nr:AAA-like domain-containing protein [Nostoc sp. ChiSLP03a]MDZ8212567.1 AAA-like domain-containing protein [Nostoc sp. ChiSLP03a]